MDICSHPITIQKDFFLILPNNQLPLLSYVLNVIIQSVTHVISQLLSLVILAMVSLTNRLPYNNKEYVTSVLTALFLIAGSVI